MNQEMSQIYKDTFRERGLIPSEPIPGRSPLGKCYSILPEIGKGYCWVYALNDHVSIAIIDQHFHKDCVSEIAQPSYLTIGYYESVSGEVLTPYRRLTSGTIHAHVGKQGIYRFVHHAGVPVRGISITMMPEYYETFLKEKYQKTYENPMHAFSAIDGAADFRELASVLLQIRNYDGNGMAAAMFYESKLKEVLSLILQRAQKSNIHTSGRAPEKSLSKADLDALLSVASYIDEHYSEEVPLGFLVKIACMSKAKLMKAFKMTYHCSIHQYQQSRRIAHAQHLLKNTSLSVSEIAGVVGYRNHGSFSEIYKKTVGISPIECRRQNRKP